MDFYKLRTSETRIAVVGLAAAGKTVFLTSLINLVSQVSSTLAALASLPDAVRYSGYGALAILVGASCSRLVVASSTTFDFDRIAPCRSRASKNSRIELDCDSSFMKKRQKLENANLSICDPIPLASLKPRF
jgi:GTPase SAR1 family protein